jgi:predicted DNA-binding antitoxin AbrB/MazE fold protein
MRLPPKSSAQKTALTRSWHTWPSGPTGLQAPGSSKFPSDEGKKTSSAALNIDHVHISVYISPNISGADMKIKAIYENNVLKPLGDLNLPNKALVSITIHESFSDLLDKLGEPEAREDIDAVLKEMRYKKIL